MIDRPINEDCLKNKKSKIKGGREIRISACLDVKETWNFFTLISTIGTSFEWNE